MSYEGKMLWSQDCLELHIEKHTSSSPVFVFKAFRHEDDTWQDVLRMEMWDFAFFVSIVKTGWEEILRWRMNMAGWEVSDGNVSEEIESGESTKS